MAAYPIAARASTRALRGRVFALALSGLTALAITATASMLTPRLEDRAHVDVPYDPGGPVAQPFRAFGLDGWLVRQADGRVRAFSAAEPRTACRIDFIGPGHPYFTRSAEEYRGEGGFFVDRCWGSKWTLEGAISFGPSWRGMDEFQISVTGSGQAILDMSRIRIGTCARGAEDRDCSRTEAPRYRRPQIGPSGLLR